MSKSNSESKSEKRYFMLPFFIAVITWMGFCKSWNIGDTAGPYKVILHRSEQNNDSSYIELFNNGEKILFKETQNYTYVALLKEYNKIVLLSNLKGSGKTHLLVITFSGNEV